MNLTNATIEANKLHVLDTCFLYGEVAKQMSVDGMTLSQRH